MKCVHPSPTVSKRAICLLPEERVAVAARICAVISNLTAAQMARMTEAPQASRIARTRTQIGGDVALMNADDATGLSSRYHRSRRVVSIPIQRTRALGDPAHSHKEHLGNGNRPRKLCRGPTTSFRAAIAFKCHSDNGSSRRHTAARRVTSPFSRFRNVNA